MHNKLRQLQAILQPKVVFQKLNYVLKILKFHILRQIPYLKSPLLEMEGLNVLSYTPRKLCL